MPVVCDVNLPMTSRFHDCERDGVVMVLIVPPEIDADNQTSFLPCVGRIWASEIGRCVYDIIPKPTTPTLFPPLNIVKAFRQSRGVGCSSSTRPFARLGFSAPPAAHSQPGGPITQNSEKMIGIRHSPRLESGHTHSVIPGWTSFELRFGTAGHGDRTEIRINKA